MQIEIIGLDSPHLPKVKRLGKENSSTLGFLPEGAFDDHARKKQILAAVGPDGSCYGYVLYRISKRTVKIVHLCVNKSSRGIGVAKQLIDELKDSNRDLLGIGLRCRRDYEATKIWPKFGFVPIDELEGRGKVPKPLIYWWFDHKHPTLFDIKLEADKEEKIDVVVDANVFFDFEDDSRDGFEESNSLRADWLEDSLRIHLVNEIYLEINRCDQEEIRSKSRATAATFPIVQHDEKSVVAIYKELSKLIHAEKPTLSERDESDIRQVSAAICGNVKYFVTRDGVLLRPAISDKISSKHDLKVLRPVDLIRELDELKRESEYQPEKLSGTSIEIALAKSGNEILLTDHFQQREAKGKFLKRLRTLMSDVVNCKCWVVEDELGNHLAFFVTTALSDRRTGVPIFRATKNRISSTLVRHLVAKIVRDSIAKGNSAIEFTDLYLSPESEVALAENGFGKTGDTWTKFSLQLVATKSDLSNELCKLQPKTSPEKDFLKNISSVLDKDVFFLKSEVFADVEKLLYPVKIIDSLLPCFIVPIQPNWAKELFDDDLACQGLFNSKSDLALRIEQVYYRKPKNSGGLNSPARILWYVSQGKSRYSSVGAIRACSMVDEVIVGKPKAIFATFKRLGIYEWKNIYDLADQNIENDIMAIRFSHTELLSSPIGLHDIKSLFQQFNTGLQLQSPLKIPQDLFLEIYRRGINYKSYEDPIE